MSKILITGGTGFIGSHIVEYFQTMGEDIDCVTRREADIRDRQSLNNAFKNARCVIHNAAMASDWGSYTDFYRNNVEGTVNVINACINNGVSQVIVTGSCSVYGEEDNCVVKDEASGFPSHYPYFMDRLFPCAMNYYRDTKRLAKAAAMKLARLHGLNLTVIDPVWVYGEREFHTGFYQYVKTVQSGMPVIMGSKNNNFHVVYVRDLARAYFLAYQKKLLGVDDFIIGSAQAERMDRVFSLFCQQAGLAKPAYWPKTVMYPLGLVSELAYTLAGAKKPPALTRARVNMFYDNIEYNTQKAQNVLGFECLYDLERGVADTVRWYQENGYL